VLKAQGLVQELSAGLGEELRAGRGWSTFTITCSLTPAGEDAVLHIVATLHRAVALLRGLGEVDRQRTWQEAAQLAAVRWYWRDATEPLDAVQSAALALHHHPVHKLLSGQTLMQVRGLQGRVHFAAVSGIAIQRPCLLAIAEPGRCHTPPTNLTVSCHLHLL
jgi:secreted Zn-dependent insulinase-like peptidase